MDGSNGKIIELLQRIADGQDSLRKEMHTELGGLRGEMRDGFAQVNGRLDNTLRFLGRYHADHEERIRALEGVVFKPSKPKRKN